MNVIAQTSNEHLDELNARAQAIRQQHEELGEPSIPGPGRPYELRPGDHVQVRRTIHHHDHGQLRNGTSVAITAVNPGAGTLDLRLADGTELRLNPDEIANADLRLAYAQHPFPAQGQTTDTAHLIVTGNATREGTYVALTRAREETHIYTADTPDRSAELDRLQELADRINHTEPKVPSIETPLAHEAAIQAETATATRRFRVDRDPEERSPTLQTELEPPEPEPRPVAELAVDADSADRTQSD